MRHIEKDRILLGEAHCKILAEESSMYLAGTANRDAQETLNLSQISHYEARKMLMPYDITYVVCFGCQRRDALCRQHSTSTAFIMLFGVVFRTISRI